MQYTINLQAGVKLRQGSMGKTLAILSTGAAASLDVDIDLQGFAAESLRGLKRGATIKTPGFSGASFTASVNCTIEVIFSDAQIEISGQDGASVNATIVGTVPVSAAAPLAVINDRGTAGTPVYVSGITYSDAPAVTLQDNAAVTVAAVAAVLVAANAARRGLRFTNIGTDPVAIGAAGITWAKRCLILASGDSWVEERAANLAWFGICDTAKTASITVQEVLA